MDQFTKNYVDAFMADLTAKNPGEKEFHQAVSEVLESVAPYIVEHPYLMDQKILERIVEPERIIMSQIQVGSIGGGQLAFAHETGKTLRQRGTGLGIVAGQGVALAVKVGCDLAAAAGDHLKAHSSTAAVFLLCLGAERIDHIPPLNGEGHGLIHVGKHDLVLAQRQRMLVSKGAVSVAGNGHAVYRQRLVGVGGALIPRHIRKGHRAVGHQFRKGQLRADRRRSGALGARYGGAFSRCCAGHGSWCIVGDAHRNADHNCQHHRQHGDQDHQQFLVISPGVFLFGFHNDLRSV